MELVQGYHRTAAVSRFISAIPEVRIELPTDAAVTLHYSCGMAMYKGKLVVK